MLLEPSRVHVLDPVLCERQLQPKQVNVVTVATSATSATLVARQGGMGPGAYFPRPISKAKSLLRPCLARHFYSIKVTFMA